MFFFSHREKLSILRVPLENILERLLQNPTLDFFIPFILPAVVPNDFFVFCTPPSDVFCCIGLLLSNGVCFSFSKLSIGGFWAALGSRVLFCLFSLNGGIKVDGGRDGMRTGLGENP